jgi:hypothetical protein
MNFAISVSDNGRLFLVFAHFASTHSHKNKLQRLTKTTAGNKRYKISKKITLSVVFATLIAIIICFIHAIDASQIIYIFIVIKICNRWKITNSILIGIAKAVAVKNKQRNNFRAFNIIMIKLNNFMTWPITKVMSKFKA